jgi:hypothetical protein
MKTDPIARTYQARPLDSGTGRSKGMETVVRIIVEPAAVAGFQTPPRCCILAGWQRRQVLGPCYNALQSAAQGRLGARATRHKVRQMRKRDLLHALVTCFLAVIATPSLAQDDEIRWLDNYREVIQEAKRTQKPIFLEFRCEP